MTKVTKERSDRREEERERERQMSFQCKMIQTGVIATDAYELLLRRIVASSVYYEDYEDITVIKEVSILSSGLI